VPTRPLPPPALLTLHVTAFELVPVTVAVNCTVCPSETDAFCGDMLTVTFCGGVLELPVVNPHPQYNSANATPLTPAQDLVKVTKGFDNRNESPRSKLI
jgi:hypothetical protein